MSIINRLGSCVEVKVRVRRAEQPGTRQRLKEPSEPFHLFLYLDTQTFRYNQRKDGPMVSDVSSQRVRSLAGGSVRPNLWQDEPRSVALIDAQRKRQRRGKRKA